MITEENILESFKKDLEINYNEEDIRIKSLSINACDFTCDFGYGISKEELNNFYIKTLEDIKNDSYKLVFNIEKHYKGIKFYYYSGNIQFFEKQEKEGSTKITIKLTKEMMAIIKALSLSSAYNICSTQLSKLKNLIKKDLSEIKNKNNIESTLLEISK